MRPVATPCRRSALSSSVLSCIEPQLLSAASALLEKLPEKLRSEASRELSKRIGPEIQAWLQHYEHSLEDTLEPEEPDSEQELPSDEERQVKRRRQAPPVPQDGYPAQVWRRAQGQAGFNAHARRVLRSMLGTWRSPSQGDVELLKQQQVAASLIHPKSPVSRVLLDHNTGSGKTLIMLRVLDNFFFDERAKIIVVPKDTVMWNMYSCLWEWPSRWRDFACQQNATAAELACGRKDWRSRRSERWALNTPALTAQVRNGLSLQDVVKTFLLQPMRDCLEMKRAFYNGKVRKAYLEKYWASASEDVHPPAAPLRVYRFTSAGGRAAEIVEGAPRGCVFKVGFDGVNPYSGKVVLMDEGHHLTRPNKIYESQLTSLRHHVHTAQNSVFVSLTGSMADSAADPRKLLDVVKGQGNEALSDEGFLSSHHRRGLGFPQQSPAACADGVFPEDVDGLVHREELTGHSLVRYVHQCIKLQKEGKSYETLACYVNIHCFTTAVGNATCKQQLLTLESCRPKFTAALKDVMENVRHKQKSLVMVSKRAGYRVMLWLLEAAGQEHGFGVAQVSQMADFNKPSNARGEEYMVMLLEAELGESIEFKCVRHALFLDVPSRYADLKQRCGRVVRCRSHQDLPEAERRVQFKFYAADFPEEVQHELGIFALWALCGFWTHKKITNYAVEPDPDEIQEAAEAFVKAMEARQIDSLQELVDELEEGCDPWDLVEEALDCKEQAKLAKRLYAGLLELPTSPEVMLALSEHTTTYDESRLADLFRECAEMAPAMDRVRCNAVDAGLYSGPC